MPVAIGSIGSGWPMTPVEAMMTSFALRPDASASSMHILRAIASPLGAQVLALPELQSIACARPSAMLALVTAMGAPLTALSV